LLIIKKVYSKGYCKNSIKFWWGIKKIYVFSCFYIWFIFIEISRFTGSLTDKPPTLWYCCSINCLEILRRFISKFRFFSQILWYQDSSLNASAFYVFNLTWYSRKNRFLYTTYYSLLVSRLRCWLKLAQQYRI
jgi:hypothetical protein